MNLIIAMFWEHWGVNEWGAFAGIVTLIVTCGGGWAAVKIRNWGVKLGKDAATTAAAMFHVAETTRTVASNTGRITAHDILLEEHGKKLIDLKVTQDEHGKKIAHLTPAPPEVKETIVGK